MIEVVDLNETTECELCDEPELIITLSGKRADKIDNISIYFKDTKEEKKDE